MAYTRTAPAAHGPVTTTTYRKWPIARHLRLSQFWWGFSRQWGWKYTKRNMSHLSSLWQVQVHCVSALALFCFIQLNILSQVSFSLAHKHYITEDNLLLSGSFVCLPYHLHPRQSASTSSFAGAACQCFPFMFCKHTLLHIVSPFYLHWLVASVPRQQWLSLFAQWVSHFTLLGHLIDIIIVPLATSYRSVSSQSGTVVLICFSQISIHEHTVQWCIVITSFDLSGRLFA